jgi:hypothetical protein
MLALSLVGGVAGSSGHTDVSRTWSAAQSGSPGQGTKAVGLLSDYHARALARSTKAPPRQAVAVAFLEPKTEVDVDVVSGALSVGGFRRPFYEPEYRKQRPALAGFLDPYTHSVFVYRSGGIPKLPEPDRSLGATQVPGIGSPPWSAPQVLLVGPHLERVVLADGRYAEVATNRHGSVITVRWQPGGGPWVSSTISYESDRRTTVRMPFGVSRTYVHDRAGLITEVLAKGAREHAHSDTVGGLLDSHATGRTRALRLPLMGRAEREIERPAEADIGNTYQDQSANGSYFIFGVHSLAAARAVNREIARLGLLDAAEAVPERASFAGFSEESHRLEPLDKLLGTCVVQVGFGNEEGAVVSISRAITRAEVEQLDSFLEPIPDWIYIEWGARTECVTRD